MSEYKTLIDEIVNEFKNECKQITSMKVNQELKVRHGIKISNSEVKKIIEELKKENEKYEEDHEYDWSVNENVIINDMLAEIEKENVVSYKVYDFNQTVCIPKDYYIYKFKNEKESNGKYSDIATFIIDKFNLDFIPKDIEELIELLPVVKESYVLNKYGNNEIYDIHENNSNNLKKFRGKITIINYGYDLDKILNHVYLELSDKDINVNLEKIYCSPKFKGDFELHRDELRIVLEYIMNKNISKERLFKALDYFIN